MRKTTVTAYLNSCIAVRGEEALALCSDVRPAPLEQVDDGRSAVLGVGVVLSRAEPQEGQQDEQLHDVLWKTRTQKEKADM